MTEQAPVAPKREAEATESDEEQVLQTLYGSPDEQGFYRGAPLDGDDD